MKRDKVCNKLPIKSYTFVQPRKKFFINALKNYNDMLSNQDSIRIYFNTSQYPFLLISEGNNLLNVFKGIINFIIKYKEIVKDSSTRFAISYSSEHGLIRDDNVESGLMIGINLKFDNLKSMEDIIKCIRKDKDLIVLERQGWYDVIILSKIKSVYDSHNLIYKIRGMKIAKDQILHTSTFFGLSGDVNAKRK